MSFVGLDSIFKPKCVAVVGASEHADHVGHVVLRNLISSGYKGQVYPVNPNHEAVQGLTAHPSIPSLPEVPDLVVVCTPAPTVLSIARQCAEAGVKGLVVMAGGYREVGARVRALEDQILEVVRSADGMRMLGPHSLGLITPRLGLNAAFNSGMPLPGNLAFIAQSGSLATSVLDWAAQKNIGFSKFVSVGNMADIGLHDLIDYFGQDRETDAILLYLESIKRARAFVSAAKAFTQNKPIIVYKAGRFERSAKAAASHTGALMGADDVHDAAFQRAGIERVFEIGEMFDTAELLSRSRVPRGGKLAIVTNSGGTGVMATDALLARGGKLADLSEDTLKKLEAVLPPGWSHGNPVNLLGDAPPQRYSDAIEAVLEDRDVDVLLVILTTQALTDATRIAESVVHSRSGTRKTVLAAWLGGAAVERGRKVLTESGIPTFASPERAIRGLMHMVNYATNIELLYETPRDVPEELNLDVRDAKTSLATFLSNPDAMVGEREAKLLLASVGIPVSATYLCPNVDAAAKQAESTGYPVVMKIHSPQIRHKTEVDGVSLNLSSAEEVRGAYEAMIASARALRPDAKIHGVTIEPQIDSSDSVEIILGSKKDPIFGAVILFGVGGFTAEVWKDSALGLPPLTEAIVRRKLESLRAYPLLEGFRGKPPVDMNALIDTIIRFSYLIAETPNIREMDINPLVVGPKGVVAVDARLITDDSPTEPDRSYSHLAIRPYPLDLIRKVTLKNGETAIIRPIRPEDEPRWHEMLENCSAETKRARFFSAIGSTTHEMATRYCYIDYDREMAMVAILEKSDRMIAVGRLVANATGDETEYAILVVDAWQKSGLGTLLTQICLDLVRMSRIPKVVASTLFENHGMCALFDRFGFSYVRDRGEEVIEAELRLDLP